MKSSRVKLKRIGFLISALFILGLFSSGCSSQLIPGEQAKFHKEVEIYFASGEDKFFPITEEMAELLLEDVSWANTGGLIFVEKSVTIKADEVKWDDGVTEYSCEGIVIDASGVVEVEGDCPEGKQTISLDLPYLMYLSELTGTVPKIASYHPETLFLDRIVPIETFFIYPTSEERGNTRWLATGFILGGLAAVAIIWALIWFVIRFIKRRFFKIYD